MKNLYQFPTITHAEPLKELPVSEVIYVDFKKKQVIKSIIQEDLVDSNEEDDDCLVMF